MTDTIKISRELLELALSNVLQGPPLDRIVKAKQELRKMLATPPADAADMGGQAGEEVEVVGYLDAHDCLWNETTHPDRMILLMTVGQHQRIVAVISAQQSAHVSVPRELLVKHLREIGEYAWEENTDDQLRALLNGGEA